MSIIALMVAAAMQALAPPQIVVTGTPLEKLKADAAHCKQSACTLRQEAIASIRYAEGLFRVGRYYDARRALGQTIRRHRANGRSDPAAMIALYEATATVSRHDGEQFAYEDATYARSRLLRDITAPDSAEQLLADLDIADLEAARRADKLPTDLKYGNLAAKAQAARQPAVAARIAIHHAMFAQGRNRPAQAAELLASVIRSPEAPQAYALVARALSARFARERGDQRAVDRFVNEIVRAPATETPLLVWGPVPPAPGNALRPDAFGTYVQPTSAGSNYNTLSWVDIGFTIKSDGTVEAPTVLRGNRGEQWATPLLKAIAMRRYAPFGTAADAHYRLERWTLTADWDAPMGSLVRRRVSNPHYEQLDMTEARPIFAERTP